MNIAVFGWYHHRNAGDDRMQYCITRWLDGHCLAFLPAGRPPPVELLRTYDAVIIGGGSIISAGAGMYRNMARWVRAAGIPVAMVGVSLTEITPELRRELRAFFDLDLCCFAWFRDQESVELVGSHPKAFAAPDITWLYPFPVMPPTAAARPSVAVCLRKQRDLPVERWRRVLATLARDHDILPWPLYFENGGDAAVLAEALGTGSGAAGQRAAVGDKGLASAMERNATSARGSPVHDSPFTIHDSPSAAEFTLEPVRRATAVVSGRFHGLLFALQMGRPVLAVGSLPKTRRFLAANGLEPWWVTENQPERLLDLCPALLAESLDRDGAVASLRERLHKQTTNVAADVRQRLLDAAARLPPPSRRPRNRLRRWLDFGQWF